MASPLPQTSFGQDEELHEGDIVEETTDNQSDDIKEEVDEDVEQSKHRPKSTHELSTEDSQHRDGSKRSDNAHFFHLRFKNCLGALADTLYRCDEKGISDICDLPGEESAKMTKCRIQQILLSMSRESIEGLILGNLAAIPHVNTEVCAELRRIRMRALYSNHPCIYYLAIADEKGQAPTPIQMSRLEETLQSYKDHTRTPSTARLIFRIDQYSSSGVSPSTHEEIERGNRKYTNSFYDEEREEMLKSFIRALRRRLRDTAGEPCDNPMSSALGYVGFTENMEQRFENHSQHRCSNWLMNLCDATLNTLYPGIFKLHMIPVFLLWQQEQAKLAEVTITRLAQVYIDHAGGFVSSVPGRSNQDAEVIDQDTEITYTAYRDKHSPFLKQLEEEETRQMEKIHCNFSSKDIDTLIKNYEIKHHLGRLSWTAGIGLAALKVRNWILHASEEGYSTSEIRSVLRRYEEEKINICAEYLSRGQLSLFEKRCYEYLIQRREQNSG